MRLSKVKIVIASYSWINYLSKWAPLLYAVQGNPIETIGTLCLGE